MRGAGGVDEDGGHAAAVAAGAVDAQQEHHAGDGGHGVGDGQEQITHRMTLSPGIAAKTEPINTPRFIQRKFSNVNKC